MGRIWIFRRAALRRSRLTEKVMRLLQTLSSHCAKAARMATATICTMICITPAKSTRPLPSIRSMALPQRMGIYSWAATLTAATMRLHPTKKR